MKQKDGTLLVDDNHESIWTLLQLLTPALVIGLVLGIGISFVTANMIIL